MLWWNKKNETEGTTSPARTLGTHKFYCTYTSQSSSPKSLVAGLCRLVRLDMKSLQHSPIVQFVLYNLFNAQAVSGSSPSAIKTTRLFDVLKFSRIWNEIWD